MPNKKTYYVAQLKTMRQGYEYALKQWQDDYNAKRNVQSGAPLSPERLEIAKRNIDFNKKRIAKIDYLIKQAGNNKTIDVPASVSADLKRGGVK